MAIRAKFLGQDCTVEATANYAGETIFLIAALPGQAFHDGSVLFTAYRPELTDVEQVSNPAQAEAIENWQAAIADTDNLVDQDARYAVGAALSIERLALAAVEATL